MSLLLLTALLAETSSGSADAQSDTFCDGRILLVAPTFDLSSSYSVGDRALLVTCAQQARQRCPTGRVVVVGQGRGPHHAVGYGTTHVTHIRDLSSVSAVLIAGADVLDGRYGCCEKVYDFIKEAMVLTGGCRIPLSLISFSFDIDFPSGFSTLLGNGTCLRPRSASSCHRVARRIDVPPASHSDSGGLAQVVETADIVFLLEPRLRSQLPPRMLEDLEWIELQVG